VLLIGHDPPTGQAIDVPERAHRMVAAHVPGHLRWRRSQTAHRGLAV
jgi:hypothetical protein